MKEKEELEENKKKEEELILEIKMNNAIKII